MFKAYRYDWSVCVKCVDDSRIMFGGDVTFPEGYAPVVTTIFLVKTLYIKDEALFLWEL